MNPEIVVTTLGSGGAQAILAVCLFAVSGVCVYLARELSRSQRDRIGDLREVLKQQAADARLVADAMHGLKATFDLALATFKGGR